MSFPLNVGEANLPYNIFAENDTNRMRTCICTTPHETSAKHLDRQLTAHERCRLWFCNKTQTHEQTEYSTFSKNKADEHRRPSTSAVTRLAGEAMREAGCRGATPRRHFRAGQAPRGHRTWLAHFCCHFSGPGTGGAALWLSLLREGVFDRTLLGHFVVHFWVTLWYTLWSL